jgi:membrane dipeptidase
MTIEPAGDPMTDALKLHHEALVIDGLVYHCDGDVTDLKAGGIDALNIATCHFEADFTQACSEIARWHGIINQPGSPWLQVETAADLDRAKSDGKIGLIMGMQNIRPVADELERLYFFRRLGLRIMQLTYNFRNGFGDGCLEHEEAGLTILGRDAIRIMNEIGIAIDLSTSDSAPCSARSRPHRSRSSSPTRMRVRSPISNATRPTTLSKRWPRRAA